MSEYQRLIISIISPVLGGSNSGITIGKSNIETSTLANDQIDAQILIYLLQSSIFTCFKQYLALSQEVKLY
jgi:hypothetical protein